MRIAERRRRLLTCNKRREGPEARPDPSQGAYKLAQDAEFHGLAWFSRSNGRQMTSFLAFSVGIVVPSHCAAFVF